MLIRCLLVTPRERDGERIARCLADLDVIVDAGRWQDDLWEQVGEKTFDALVSHARALGHEPEETLSTLASLPSKPTVVVLTDAEDANRRTAFLAAGATAVLTLEVSDDELQAALRTVLLRPLPPLNDVNRPPATFAEFDSAHDSLRDLVAMARKVSRSDTSVLVLGETGVGKERLARAIHEASPRATGPFVAINCAAIPEHLVESELFGHERGAFTGAIRSRRGVFELAHRGTLFLDEIGELPATVQTKLLRALQERQVTPVGSEKPISVDVRFIAATHRNLPDDVAQKHFRADLYYRLSVFSLTIPPLRDRPKDIPWLAETFRARFVPPSSRVALELAPEAIDALVAYTWPGNVRELVNVIERAVLLCETPLITPDLLPELSRGSTPTARLATVEVDKSDWLTQPWRDVRRNALARLEREYLSELLRATAGKVGDAARIADIDPRSLFDKLKAHGLRKEDFRGTDLAQREE